jgi:hypothetical protein
MTLSRRSFLQAGGMMSLATIIGGGATLAAFGQENRHTKLGSGVDHPIPKSAYQQAVAQLNSTAFRAMIGETFAFWLNGTQRDTLTLIAVTDLNPSWVKTPGGPRECFTVTFSGSTLLALNQGTYQVLGKEVNNVGVFDLFIVPASVSGSTAHYEALFNRLYP